MGAVPYSDTKKNYYNVNGFMFTKRAADGQEGAVMRKITKRDGSVKEVWEFLFKELNGNIVNIDVKDTDWGKQYEITLDDVGETMCLQVNVESGYGDTFAARLPNVDPDKPVQLLPYSFIPEGETRKKEGINIFQYGTKVLPFFTKEKPGDMPSVSKLQAAGVMSDPPESGDWKTFFGLIHKFLATNTVKIKDKFNRTKEPIPSSGNLSIAADEVGNTYPLNPSDAPDDLPFKINPNYFGNQI